MGLTESLWSEVSGWFEQLADLTVEQRSERLAGETLDPEVRRYLDQLLTAHDTPEPLLIDRTVEGIVDDLIGRQASAQVPNSWIDVTLGQWRVQREIRRGGMATVVLAERADGQYERQVALKVLHARTSDPGDRRSLERELQLLASLAHPRIVHLLDGGVSEQGWPYLVMEYVEGEAIDEWCQRHHASLEQRIDLLRQVTRAVSHAHGRLIVHADLKPANVLVDDEGRARLVDFGIGRLLGEKSDSPLKIGLRCSPAWAAPEQLDGEAATVVTDVHGLGMLAYGLLTGQSPRPASAVTRAIAGLKLSPSPGMPSGAGDTPVPANHLRGDLDAICARATAEDPEDRYTSAEALERDLAAWASGHPVHARQGGLAYRAGKWLNRHRLGVATSTLALVALLVGSGLALWQARVAQDQALRAGIQAERAETIKDFLLSMFTAADPWLAGDSDLDIRDVLAQGGRQLESNRSLDPATRVELLTTLGDVQVALSQHNDAAARFDDAQVILDENPAIGDEWRVRLWLERASLAGAQSDHRVQESALDQARDLLPPDAAPGARLLHVRVAVGYAALFARENRAEEAQAAFDEVERLLAQPGDSLIDIRLLLLGARTYLAFNQGEIEAAYQWALEELALLEQMDQAHDSRAVSTLSNLGGTAAQLGLLDEALTYDRRAAELAREVYPEGHPNIGRALYAYGDTLRQHGRFEDALVALDEASEIQASAELAIAQALTNLVRARTLLALGRGAPASELAREARETLEASWGPATRTSLQAVEFEAFGHALSGNGPGLAQAEAVATERLAALGDNDRWQPLAQILRWRLARAHFDNGELAEASSWMEQTRDAPDDVVRHPSATARLLGLELLLGDVDGIAASALIDQIEAEIAETAANDDSRAFALCALARHQSMSAERGVQAATLERLDQLVSSSRLSHEGLQDSRCLAARPR
ncbi:MAG: serine/threonine-protein kinase [Pseudomonadota bacterium]